MSGPIALTEATYRAGVPYYLAWRAAQRGELRAIREPAWPGRKWRRWVVDPIDFAMWLTQRQAVQREMTGASTR